MSQSVGNERVSMEFMGMDDMDGNGARWEWSQREAVRHRWGDPNG